MTTSEGYEDLTIYYTKRGFSFDVWMRDKNHGKIHLGRHYDMDFISLFEDQGYQVKYAGVVFDGIKM